MVRNFIMERMFLEVLANRFVSSIEKLDDEGLQCRMGEVTHSLIKVRHPYASIERTRRLQSSWKDRPEEKGGSISDRGAA